MLQQKRLKHKFKMLLVKCFIIVFNCTIPLVLTHNKILLRRFELLSMNFGGSWWFAHAHIASPSLVSPSICMGKQSSACVNKGNRIIGLFYWWSKYITCAKDKMELKKHLDDNIFVKVQRIRLLKQENWSILDFHLKLGTWGKVSKVG